MLFRIATDKELFIFEVVKSCKDADSCAPFVNDYNLVIDVRK